MSPVPSTAAANCPKDASKARAVMNMTKNVAASMVQINWPGPTGRMRNMRTAEFLNGTALVLAVR